MHKELIFSPKKKSYFKKSVFHALPMISRTLSISSHFLMESTVAADPIKCADKHINNFWRAHFEESHTSLFVCGRENIEPNKNYIFMSNHGSWMDIPAVFGAVPNRLRMISKEGLMKVPVFGKAMFNAGFIAIDRKNRRKAIKQLEIAKDRLKSGISIWLAPEGTRSRSDELLPFKKGGFYLACDLNIPIVPIYIENASRVMPADSLKVTPNLSITVHIMPPIDTANANQKSKKELIQKVRHAILEKKQECESTTSLNNDDA